MIAEAENNGVAETDGEAPADVEIPAVPEAWSTEVAAFNIEKCRGNLTLVACALGELGDTPHQVVVARKATGETRKLLDSLSLEFGRYAKEIRPVQDLLWTARNLHRGAERLHKEASKATQLAEHDARRIVEQAHADADAIRRAAEDVTEAQKEADIIREAAHKKAKAIVDKSKAAAQELDRRIEDALTKLAQHRATIQEKITKARELDDMYARHIARKLRKLHELDVEIRRMEAVAQIVADRIAEDAVAAQCGREERA